MIKNDLQNNRFHMLDMTISWNKQEIGNLSLNEIREEKIHIILDVILQQGSWTVQCSVTSTLRDFRGGSGKSSP